MTPADTPSNPPDDTGTPAERFGSRRRRRRSGEGGSGGGSRALRFVAWSVGALVVLGLGTNVLLSRFLDPEQVAEWVAPRLGQAVNREVSVASVEVRVFPLGVRLNDIRVADPTGLAAELASLGQVELRVALLPLLRRDVQVRSLRIQALDANLRVDADGRSNFGDFSAAASAGVQPDAEPSDVMALELDGIRLTGGRLSYRSEADSVEAALYDVAGVARLQREESGAWEVEAEVSGALHGPTDPSESTLVGTDGSGGLPLALEVALDAPGSFESVRIREGRLLLNEMELALAGEVNRLKEPRRDVRLALTGRNLPVAELLELLPSRSEGPELDGSGTLSVDLNLAGPLGPDTLPAATGTVEVARGSVRVDGMDVITELQATVEVEEDRTLRPRVRGRLLGGDLAVDGVVRAGTPMTLDLQVEAAPELGLLPDPWRPEGVEAAGRVVTALRVAGDPADASSLGLWGTVRGEELDVEHPALRVPVTVDEAIVELEGDRFTLSPAALVAGGDRVELAGAFYGLRDMLVNGGIPEFRGTASGNRVSLPNLLVETRPESAPTYGQVAFARVGGRAVDGVPADDAARELGLRRPQELPLSGQVEVALDTVVTRTGLREELQATLVFGPDFIQLTESTFRQHGGSFRTTGTLEVGADDEEPFSFQLVATGVDAGDFLAQSTPLGRAIGGTLDLQVDLTGGLDALLLPGRNSLQGTGSFRLTDGALTLGTLGERLVSFLGVEGLDRTRVSEWTGGFVLQDGRILLDESALRGAPGDPTLSGGIGLDGGLALNTVFQFPRSRLGRQTLERLGLPEAAGEMISAALQIGGSLADPRLEADPSGTAASATEAVRDEARERIDERVQEERERLEDRATNLLRGLLRRPAPEPPPDTTQATPDTIRPDSVRPDTTRPDTTRPDTTSVRRDR